MGFLKIRELLREQPRAALLCKFLAIVVGTAIVSWIWFGGWRVSKANYARIRKGMTEQEVTQILGRYTDSSFGRWPPGPNWVRSLDWRSGNHTITVHFSINLSKPDDGRAFEKCYSIEPFFVEKLLDAFGVPYMSQFQYESEFLK
jgi:hypothetical protein